MQGYTVVDSEVGLRSALAAHATRAAGAGRKPFVMLSAEWAPPCVRFFQALEDPASDVLRGALQGVDLLVVDLDVHDDLDAVGLPGDSCPAFVALDGAGRPDGPVVTGRAWGQDTPQAMARVLGPFFHGGAAPVIAPGTTLPVSPRVRAEVTAPSAYVHPTSGPPSYEAWIRSVLKAPLGSGWAGVGLTLTTLAALVCSFVFFARPMLAGLSGGRQPTLLLALPFLLMAAVAFFALSPLFYALHRRSAPAAPKPHDPARELRSKLIETVLVMLGLMAGVLIFLLWLEKNA